MTTITISVRADGFWLLYNGTERPALRVDPRTPTTFRDWQMQLGTAFGVVQALLPPGTPVEIEIGSMVLVADADGNAAVLPPLNPAEPSSPLDAPGS